MGLARKTRRKYDTPNHPWQAERIDEEKKLIDEYGLTNKKQIWKMSSLLRNFRKQARDIMLRNISSSKIKNKLKESFF